MFLVVPPKTIEASDEEEQERLIASKLKPSVRERDGCKCRCCGITQEEHFALHGADLEVHRIIPGISYHPSFCVTLCRECHDGKTSNIKQVLWSHDLRWFAFNLFDETESHLFQLLESEARTKGVSLPALLRSIVEQHIESGCGVASYADCRP